MVAKLHFLRKLKDSMGDEIAEMMSEEITKVMNEQRDLEQSYAQLVTLRGTLTGIANKPRLKDTVMQINEVQKVLKESTRKLCRQLQENPDVEGNNLEITKHKDKLIEWTQNLKAEILSADATYKNFNNDIKAELKEQKAFDELRKNEKELNFEIKKTLDEYKNV
jgi:DNA repair ATPase RecN